MAEAFRQILTRDSDWFALDLEGRLYALRNPEFRQRYVANYRKMTSAVAGFISDLAKTAGFTWKIPADRLAQLFEVSAEGFLAWAVLDPDEGALFTSFVDLLQEAIIEEG